MYDAEYSNGQKYQLMKCRRMQSSNVGYYKHVHIDEEVTSPY